MTINIDRNYVDLRTPRLPGSAAPAPAAPKYTGNSTRDAKCTKTSISRKIYRGMSAHVRKSLTVPLQCLLKQRHLYKYAVTGRWNPQTRVALRAFQRRVGQRRAQPRDPFQLGHAPLGRKRRTRCSEREPADLT